jgi:hypothetical protein
MANGQIVTDSEIIFACISTYLNTCDFEKLRRLNSAAINTAKTSPCCACTFLQANTLSLLTNTQLKRLYIHALRLAWADLLLFIRDMLNGPFAIDSIQYVFFLISYDLEQNPISIRSGGYSENIARWCMPSTLFMFPTYFDTV